VAHYSSIDYEKSYYIYDAQGNVMAIYSENKVSSVTTTRQDELPIYGSDRLGLVRRNMELDEEQARTTQLAKECPYCPVPQTIAPGMLRIVEVLYDSPLSNPTEDHTGEFVVLRNATGLTLPLASISVTYPGGVFTFGAADVLAPYEFAIVAHWSGSPGSFAAQFGLSGYNTFPEVNWFWDTAMTLPDPASRGRSAGGTVGLLDFTDGVPTLLDAVNFDFQRRGPSASLRIASNAYCATACSTAQTVQLDHFLTSPSGAFDATNLKGYNPRTGSNKRPPISRLIHELSHRYLYNKAGLLKESKRRLVEGTFQDKELEKLLDEAYDNAKSEEHVIVVYENPNNSDAGWGTRKAETAEPGNVHNSSV
jgi:hypothetical protein